MYYNRIILVGRLTRDPELRATPDGISVVRFTLAVDRGMRAGEEEITDFFDVVAFRQLADNVANYVTKGRLVLVEGKLHTRSYTDREGNRRKVFEIVADNVRFLERPRDADTESDTTAALGVQPASAPRETPPAPAGFTGDAEPPAPVSTTRTPPRPAPNPEPEDDYDIELDLDNEDDFDEDPFK
ncbi:MAG: single-stranded DNA-binding protein [Fimbriimonadales bacterium]